MTGRTEVTADLDFSLALDDRPAVRGRLHGSGSALELVLDDPRMFAGPAERRAVRWVAEELAGRGLTVTVTIDAGPLMVLGVPRASWFQRRLSGSAHIRVPGVRAAGRLQRLRAGSGRGKGRSGPGLSPPPSPLPLAPTFLRRPRRPVTTTHDPERGGDPRLVLAPGPYLPEAGDGRQVFPLREEVTTIGSGGWCDIRLEGLEEHHAEVRHDADDEFVLVDIARSLPSRVNGERVRQRILRTGSRVELGERTLTFAREEYADHGRPYGGRIGGELGRQHSQPPRQAVQGPADTGPSDAA
jgi:hypothetical protein